MWASPYLHVLLALVFFLVAIPLLPGETSQLVPFLGVLLPLIGYRLRDKSKPLRSQPLYLHIMALFSVLLGLHFIVGLDVLPKFLGYVGTILYFFAAALMLIRNIFKSPRLDPDLLLGALAAFMLIGVGWALAFALLDRMQPGCLHTDHPHQELIDYVYFSFVTLLTIGYGDVCPVTPAARIMAMFEGMTGMIFNTVVLASLVSLLLSRRSGPADNEAPDEAQA